MKPSLDITNVARIDLSDQPASKYILVMGGVESGMQAFAIDSYKDRNFLIEFYRKGETDPVVVFRLESATPWTIYRRDAVELVTSKEMIKETCRGVKRGKEFQKELVDEGLIEQHTAIDVDGARVAPEDERWARAAYR